MVVFFFNDLGLFLCPVQVFISEKVYVVSKNQDRTNGNELKQTFFF